ncbi:MAG: hypothetical protein GY906_23745 [bacterium]|nr:hypothetical protein [bacterium]
MPIYCYRSDDGEPLEQVFLRGKAPKTIVAEDGKAFRRDYQAELSGMIGIVKGSTSPIRTRAWPMTCVSSGVQATQAGELRDHLRKRGCPTEVTRDGDPVYTSATHRKKALKVRGMVDKNSFS